MKEKNKPVIVSAVRTPIGSFTGVFSPLSAMKLGGITIKEALKRVDLRGEQVDGVFMGCVLTAGLGQAPARQASIGAGIPPSIAATTVNKVCGSSLQTVIMASQHVQLGEGKVFIAGGMESMTRSPYLLTRARQGYRMGHSELIDSMIKDGLWDVYNEFHMGYAGDLCAKKHGITRGEADEFALESYRRSRMALASGAFKPESVSVEVPQKKGDPLIVTDDEEPNRVNLDRLTSLPPVFQDDGILTVGNSSACNDGAAALVIMDEHEAINRGMKPLARIVGYAGAALAPEWFTIAPVDAIRSLLKRTGHTIDHIDLFEINEAFSSVTMAVSRELRLDSAKVNVNGGAVALGHPIGAAGARILTTLLYALEARGGRLGVASLCIGGGEALAVMIERQDE